MNLRLNRLIATVLMLMGVSYQALAKPNILILATGGTISGAQLKPMERAYKPGVVLVEDLLRAIPAAKQIANITAEQICNIGSQNMNNKTWLQIASRVSAAVDDPNVDGVVITHGTDTLEETAYFLSLVVKSDKPIILTAAMRPSTALSADGPANLYNAIAVAADPVARGRGVLVAINNDIYHARDVEKMNTLSLGAFASPNRGPAGEIHIGAIVFFGPPAEKHEAKSEFGVGPNTNLPKVEIVYSYANLGRDMIDYLVHTGTVGIVLAGTGDGNTTDSALAGLEDAARAGVVVVRSSRVGSGTVLRNVELNDDQLGFVSANDLNPQKARVLLMLALMKSKDVRQIQADFDTY